MDRFNEFEFDNRKTPTTKIYRTEKSNGVQVFQVIVSIMILLFVIGIFSYFVLAHQKIREIFKENSSIDTFLSQGDKSE